MRAKRLFRYYGPGEADSKATLLEKAFAEKKGSRYSVAVTSGTAALVCGLHGIGIGPGDEVIVPAYTWIASASAVVAAGGIPVIAEVDETLLMDRRTWSGRLHRIRRRSCLYICVGPHAGWMS